MAALVIVSSFLPERLPFTRELWSVRTFGFVWGVGGILLLLSFAIVRLGGVALELGGYPLTVWQWGLVLVWLVYMVWAEGYKGFHLAFAPRVVVRANYLANNPRPVHVLLAPLYCMGYILSLIHI